MTLPEASEALRSYLDGHQAQLKRSLDPRVLDRYRHNTFAMLARRATRLSAPFGDANQLIYPGQLTLLVGAAHLSLLADLLPIGNRVTMAYRRVSDDITRGLFHHAQMEEMTDKGLIAFCDSIAVPHLTAQMQEAVNDWSPHGPLHKIRTHLGIDRSSERPFSVKVIDADCLDDNSLNDNMPTEEALANDAILDQLWFGEAPDAWVAYTPQSSVMYLRRSAAEGLLQSVASDSLAFNEVDPELFGHEYVHTQRTTLVEGTPGFGFTLNELWAADAAVGLSAETPYRRSSHYPENGMFLDMVSLVADKNVRVIIQEFGTADDVDGLYRSLAVNLGLSAMALLACDQPSNYGRSQIPETYSRDPELTVFDTVLTHRHLTRGRQDVERTIQQNLKGLFRAHPGMMDFKHLDQTLTYRLPSVFQRSFVHARDALATRVLAGDAGTVRVMASEQTPVLTIQM